MEPGPIIYTYTMIFLTCLVYEREAVRVQKMAIFSDNCCKGRSENFTKSVTDLTKGSVIVGEGRMKSYSVYTGLWALSGEENFSEPGHYQEGNEDEETQGNCGSTASGNGVYTQYRSIRSVGNPIVGLPGLSFFTGGTFSGPELYFDGTALRLPTPHQFRSYGFTGKEGYTIYPMVDFTGESSCLVSQDKVVSFMAGRSEPIKVGSLRRGCVTKGEKDTKTLHAHHALLLHKSENQLGESMYTDGHELRLPVPLTFRSHSFDGTKNWTIFSRSDFTGESQCLVNLQKPKPALGPGPTPGPGTTGTGTQTHQRKTSKHPKPIVVGSVRRGCKSDPIQEKIIPPVEVKDTQKGQKGGGGSGDCSRILPGGGGWILLISCVFIFGLGQ